MENQVEVVRYVRGMYRQQKLDGSLHTISNMHGITLVFELDYEVGIAKVSWSVCHDTNFNKKDGVAIAKLNAQKLYFPLKSVEQFGTLESALVAYLQETGYINEIVTYLDVYTPLRKALNQVNKVLVEFNCKGK